MGEVPIHVGGEFPGVRKVCGAPGPLNPFWKVPSARKEPADSLFLIWDLALPQTLPQAGGRGGDLTLLPPKIKNKKGPPGPPVI